MEAEKERFEAEKERLEEECKNTELQVVYRSEANLFAVDVGVRVQDILCLIKAARDSANNNDLPAGRSALVNAVCLLDRAVAARGRLWSLLFIHAVPIWVFHVAVVSGIIAATVCLDALNVPATSDPGWRTLVAMGLCGALGGEVRGLYWLFQKVQSGSFRRQFFIIHFGAPWLSFVLGVLSFVLLKAGVGFFTGTGGSGLYPYATTAALAGFSWEWFLEQLAKVQRAS